VNGPISPEEQARINAYWGATPANSSVPGSAPPEAAPVPAPFTPHPDAIDLDAPVPPLQQGTIPGAITYGTGAKLPGAIEYGPPAAPPPKPLSPETQAFKTGAQLSSVVAHPPPAPGPTPEDDAAFEAAKRRRAGSPARPAQPGNPDPWGIRAAQKGLMGTYDAREDASRRMGEAEADKAAVLGDHHQEIARRRIEDASINQMEQQYAAEHFESKMVELERQMDDVAAKKIDPKRLMKETPGLGFLAVIGGAIGGFYQGLTRSGENPFLKELNLMIDRDISAQEKEIDLSGRNVQGKMGLLAQQRAIFQDTQQAKLAAQALYYQAAEDELMAEAARYDQPLYKERAEMHAQEIRAEKQALLLKIAEQQRAQSMAAAGQAYTREKEVHAMYRDVYDKVLAKTGNPMLAENEARRQVGVVYSPGAVQPRQAPTGGVDPIGLVPPEQREKALEEQEKFVGAQRGKKAVQDLFAKYEEAPDLPTWTGADKREAVVSGARLNLRVALGKGFASDKDTETYIDKNLPRYGESAQARRQKLDNINNFLDSQAATPILDRHAPGWRPKDIERKDVK
jgi:hypothetical protein